MELALLPALAILIQVLWTERGGMSPSQDRGFEAGHGIPAEGWGCEDRAIGSENSERLQDLLPRWNSSDAPCRSRERGRIR
jgi:hypothetical protein